jgi:methionyl-tRNA formyltransferase
VHRAALALGLPVRTPARVRHDAAEHAAFAALELDVAVVAAYGLILPKPMLDAPRRGCLNIHASLLPRWRGAAPIHRAIEAGDAETGITIMQMDAGLDTGDMLRTERIAIAPDDTTASLHDRLAALGGRMIVDALAGPQTRTVQPAEGVTYARKIEKAEAQIDWAQDAPQIERRLRAFDPFPGALGSLDGEAVKCWRGEVCEGAGVPGEVLAAGADGITVACGSQALRLTQLQRAGGKRVTAAAFLQARPVAVGTRFT